MVLHWYCGALRATVIIADLFVSDDFVHGSGYGIDHCCVDWFPSPLGPWACCRRRGTRPCLCALWLWPFRRRGTRPCPRRRGTRPCSSPRDASLPGLCWVPLLIQGFPCRRRGTSSLLTPGPVLLERCAGLNARFRSCQVGLILLGGYCEVSLAAQRTTGTCADVRAKL